MVFILTNKVVLEANYDILSNMVKNAHIFLNGLIIGPTSEEGEAAKTSVVKQQSQYFKMRLSLNLGMINQRAFKLLRLHEVVT